MFKNKNVIAIIPARAGSKSVINKNIKKYKGKPLLFHSIEYAKKSSIIDEVVVSTDSYRYLKLIKKFKLKFSIKRQKKLSSDYVQDFPVVKDALLRSEKYFKKKFEYIILLRPTSPMRTSNLIKDSLNILLKNNKGDSVRAVQITKQNPYRQWIFSNNKKFIRPCIKKVYEPYNLPRQKLPIFFFQTGDIETIKRKTLLKGSVSGKNILPIFINKKFIDIDNLEDFKNDK